MEHEQGFYELADFAQMVINSKDPRDVLVCPWPIERGPRTLEHRKVCSICRVRDVLTPGWYLRPQD